MGNRFKWKCNECNYTAEVSGKRDYGFRGSTETYLCKNCQTITDESYQLTRDGNPIKKIIFSPFRYWLIKETIFIYKEIDNFQENQNSIYINEFERFFILSEKIIKRPETLKFFKLIPDDLFSDDLNDIEDKRKRKKIKKNRYWYNYFGFKSVEFPIVNVYHFIPQCKSCNSRDVIIWANKLCPKCGNKMEKGELTIFWD